MSAPGGNGSGNGYEVGYGRPPVATRFKKGQSGNPRGRPRRDATVAQLLDAALSRRIEVTENGNARRMTMLAVIVQGLVNDAAKRDPKALRLLLTLLAQQRDGAGSGLSQPDEAEDRAILMDYFARREGAVTAPTRPEGAADGAVAEARPVACDGTEQGGHDDGAGQ
jgi:hypothetical protein